MRTSNPTLHGVLVLDKPSGPTSHDAVDLVRRVLGERRVGHTGTLDPLATGVLPVCVGKATRLARFLAAADKTYEATVRLGWATTTDDLQGEALAAPRPVHVALDDVRRACERLTGPLLQRPPLYSAKRVGGRRLYDLAREGIALEVRPVAVVVHALQATDLRDGQVRLEVVCSSGTYVRALARDLGDILGTGGHLIALRRPRSGSFSLADAVPWDGLEAEARSRLLPLSALLAELPAVTVGEEGLAAVRHGRVLPRALVVSGFPEAPAPRFRVRSESGDLLALAVPRGFEVPGPGLAVEPVLHPDVVLIE